MYALILVIGMSGVSGGVTSQIVGKFRNLDDCKSAASQPHAVGTIADPGVSVSWGTISYCAYIGTN
jgi:hypothetical protein